MIISDINPRNSFEKSLWLHDKQVNRNLKKVSPRTIKIDVLVPTKEAHSYTPAWDGTCECNVCMRGEIK